MRFPPFLLCSMLLLAGCVSRETARPASSLLAALPSPGSLRSASGAGGTYCAGSDFDAAAPRANVNANASNAEFSPLFSGPAATLDHAAYALYRFDLTGLAGAPELRLQWGTAPAPGTAWVGLADQDADRWAWQPLATPLSAEPLAKYQDGNGAALVAVLLLGDLPASLSAVYFGASAAPEPTASLTVVPPAGNVPVVVTLDGSASQPNGGSLVRYEWDFEGDGAYDHDSGATASVEHEYYVPIGTHTAGLRVTDSEGYSAETTAAFEVTGARFSPLAEEQFVDASDPGDSAQRRWQLNCYRPLPAWGDFDRCFQSYYFSLLADEVYVLINAERAKALLPPLERWPHLELVAQAHSRDMALRGFVAHDNPDGLSHQDRVDAVDAPPCVVLENIATGSLLSTAQKVVEAWMNSPSHAGNVLTAWVTHTGVGVYYQDPAYGGGNEAMYWTQVFCNFPLTQPEDNDWLDPEEVPGP